MFLIGSLIIVIIFIILFCIPLILEVFGYNTDDIHTIPGLISYISIILPMLLLFFILLSIKI
jgi:hypothetical protein